MFQIPMSINVTNQNYRRKLSYLILIIVLVFVTITYPLKRFYNRTEDDENIIPYSDQNIDTEHQYPFYKGCKQVDAYVNDLEYHKMNATCVMLTRNEEIEDVIKTIESLESHFNQWYHYPYVFLNDEPFTNEFIERVKQHTNSDVQFGTINQLDWNFPEEVEKSFEYREALLEQGDRGVMYGYMESYHKMCRFYSGLFYRHPLVRSYEWYWRIEPDVDFFCDITYDPFYEMKRHGKRYGFTVVIQEIYATVPNLFRATRSYINQNKIKMGSLWKLFTDTYEYADTEEPYLKKTVFREADLYYKISQKVAIDHLVKVSQENGESNLNDEKNEEGLRHLINRAQSKVPIFERKFDNEDYNGCHFWSNFEIAKRDVFDNPVYDNYFKHLEKLGGFWKERWGDAPVHSLGLALTLDFEQVHYFRDIGYRHSSLQHCPNNAPTKPKIPYVSGESKYDRSHSTLYDKPSEFGSGCRCQCPEVEYDVEDYSFPCMDRWLELGFEVENNFNFKDGKYYPYMNLSSFENGIKNDFETRF